MELVEVTTKPRLAMFRMKFVEGVPESLPLAALKVSPFRPPEFVRLLLTRGLLKLALKRTMSLLKVLEFVNVDVVTTDVCPRFVFALVVMIVFVDELFLPLVMLERLV